MDAIADTARLHLGVERRVSGCIAREHQVRLDAIANERSERAHNLCDPFLRRQLAERNEHDRVIADAESRADRRARRIRGFERRGAQPNCFDNGARMLVPQRVCDATVVNRDHTGCVHHQAHHRPQVVNRSAKPHDRVLDDVARDVGMVVPELVAVVVEAFQVQELPRARVMQSFSTTPAGTAQRPCVPRRPVSSSR